MKKILYYAAALLTMAFAASCQQEIAPELGRGELVDVTFSISAEPIQTKAVVGQEPIWDKELTFGVYRNGNLLSADVYTIVDDFGADNNAQVTVTLVKGQTYDFVFWADSKDTNYYTVDLEAKNVTVNYGGLLANNKYRDAWYTVLPGYKVTDSSLNQDITLKRAVAQVNVGTADYQKAVTAGVTVTKSEVTIKQVASTLDFFTGKTSNPVDVTFAANTIPMNSLPAGDNTLTVYPKSDKEKEYEYLSLNYILVADDSDTGSDKGLVTFEIDFYENGNDQPINNDITIQNVPVRRNFRTNIISENVLTDVATFDITIDPMYEGEYDYENGVWVEFPENGTVTPPATVDNNLYLAPGPWTVDGAWFAAYFYDSNDNNTNVTMVKEGDYYKCEKPSGDYHAVIFVRMDPAFTSFNWEGKWNQTGDLLIPTDGNNLYTITGWEANDGNWSTK